MTSQVHALDDTIQPDRLATDIADMFVTWDTYKRPKKNDWQEIQRYVFATNTSQTTNSQLPWKNKTTIPKLCQIRDNLLSNYRINIYPQRKYYDWEANERASDSVAKRDSIINYMRWVTSQSTHDAEMDKLIADYVDYGNAFGTVELVDERVNNGTTSQAGYVGPTIRRISPLDIVFNPIAESFERSPKVIRSLMSMGEIKEMLERMSTDDNREEYEALWTYFKDIRNVATAYDGNLNNDRIFEMDGFGTFSAYLESDTVEILTFYGDIFDTENDKLLKNHVITVVDRHKLIGKKPNPSYFGHPPIFHCAWRKRSDNLWGMGPLDNLVGMQYRLDHVENMKADIFDLVTFPVQKVKGFVEDYTWQPGEKIYVSEEGDVELVTPDVNVLQANMEIQYLEKLMEEMAGAPREALGIRTPGEKTKYEVQSLENASSRVFQNKAQQFNGEMFEKLLNAELELGRRNMTSSTTIQIFDDELKVVSFKQLSVEDITGVGRIRPIASRHFAEQAEIVQNLTNLTNSPLWQTVQPHFSSVQIAKMLERMFKLEDFEIVLPYVALSEQAEAQKQSQALEESVQMQTMTATGMGEDFDMDRLLSANPEELPPQQQRTAVPNEDSLDQAPR